MKKISLFALFFLVSCSKTSVDCEEFNICVDSFETDRWQEYTEIENLNDIPEFTQKDFWLLAYDVSKHVSKTPEKDKSTSNEDYQLMLDEFEEGLPNHYKKKYYFKSVNELSGDYFKDCRDYGVKDACYDPDNKILKTGNLKYKIEVDPKYVGEFYELYTKKIESLLDKFPYSRKWERYSNKSNYCSRPIQENVLGMKIPLTKLKAYYLEGAGVDKISRNLKIQPNEIKDAKLSVEVIFSITPYFNVLNGSRYCRDKKYLSNIDSYSIFEEIDLHYDIEKIYFNINSNKHELYSNPEI